DRPHELVGVAVDHDGSLGGSGQDDLAVLVVDDRELGGGLAASLHGDLAAGGEGEHGEGGEGGAEQGASAGRGGHGGPRGEGVVGSGVGVGGLAEAEHEAVGPGEEAGRAEGVRDLRLVEALFAQRGDVLCSEAGARTGEFGGGGGDR